MEMEGGATIAAYFAEISDPRVERTRLHELLDILVMAICAVICGADTWVEMEAYGRAKEKWLRQFLALPHGIPSHDTFARVLARLKPEELQQCFLRWMQAVSEVTHGEVVAIDGKTLRRSFDRATGKSAIHMVSAWASANRLVLGQQKVDEKSNEITAIPALLHLLELKGCIVTIDAMGCQKAIAQTIVEQEADYVLTLKANHGLLYEEVQQFFAWARQRQFVDVAHEYYHTLDGKHGRVEERRYWLVSDLSVAEREAGVGGVTESGHGGAPADGSRKNDGGSALLSNEFGREWATVWRGRADALECGEWAALGVRCGIPGRPEPIAAGPCRRELGGLAPSGIESLTTRADLPNGIKVKRLKAALDDDYLTRVLLA